MKIVLNKCFGIFELSKKALKRLSELETKDNIYKYYCETILENGVMYALIKKISDSMEDGVILLEEPIDKDILKLPYKDFLNVEHTVISEDRFWGYDEDRFWGYEMRTDKNLITVVEELGKEASTKHSNLKVFEIPDDCDWYIDGYGGRETLVLVQRVTGHTLLK